MKTSIKISGLTKEFHSNKSERRIILNNINVEFPQSRLSLIIGKNGSGKSTLLNCIAGLTSFESGVIEVTDSTIHYKLDKDSYDNLDSKVRSKVGVVFQQKALWPHLTVLENVSHPQKNVVGKNNREAKEIAEHFLRQVGLDPVHFKKYPLQLSGGEQRKVAVARTLAMNPEMLLVDELEANLDQSALETIFNVIRKNFLEIESPKTVLLISHRVDLIERYAPYTVLLNEGHIIETAENFDKLLTNQNKNAETKTFIKEVIDPARTQWYFGKQCLRASKEISKLNITSISNPNAKEEELICKIGETIFNLINELEDDSEHLLLIVTKHKNDHSKYRILSAEKNNIKLNGKDANKLCKKILTTGNLQFDGSLLYDFQSDFRNTITNQECILSGDNSVIDWIFNTNANEIFYSSMEGAEKIPGAHHIKPKDINYKGPYIELSKSTNNVYIIAIKEDDGEVKGVISIDTSSKEKWTNLVVEQLLLIANMSAIAINQLEVQAKINKQNGSK